jgi:hypothetical protein
MTYSERLRALKLPSLSYRRLRGNMIEVYKILNEKYDQDACTILKLWKNMAPRSSIRGNSLKLYPQRARIRLRKYPFAMRVVKYWNSLPEKIVTSKTLNTFKNRLDKYWEDQVHSPNLNEICHRELLPTTKFAPLNVYNIPRNLVVYIYIVHIQSWVWNVCIIQIISRGLAIARGLHPLYFR